MMPIYEYECEKCACRFELKRRFGEDLGSPRCPKCRGKVRQLFSPSAIVFKGSGFYVTDKQSNRDRSSEESKAGKVEGGKKEETKTDKVQGTKKDVEKSDKVEDGEKQEGKIDKVEVNKKEETKSGKFQSSKESESN
jgi:putative FmdB family regulatory protein